MEESQEMLADPFADCVLGRKRYATALTRLISDNQDGNVIALNNRWGAGKTTFVNMWNTQLYQEGFSTIYFNAWESDFEDNPLSALMAELKSILKRGKEFNTLLEHGGKILLSATSTLITKFIDKRLGDGVVGEIGKALTGNAQELFDEEIKDYINTKESIQKFRGALQSYIQSNSKKLPVIIFIDELDRCKPSYAVKVLETIKHIFSVPNITFVLSIDKDQLGYAIQGFYGSDKIDTTEYLRRFIDIEFSLPVPDMEKYYDYLFKKNEVWKIVAEEFGARHINSFKDPMRFFFREFTLRQMDRVASHVSIIFKSNNINGSSIVLIFFLIYLRFSDDRAYNQIKDKKIEFQDLSDLIFNIFKNISPLNNLDGQRLMGFIEAQLLFIYSKFLIRKDGYRRSFYEYDNSRVLQSSITSKIDNDFFLRTLDDLDRNGENEPDDFETILDMIELFAV